MAANKHKGDLERHLLRNTVSYMVMFTQNAIVAKTTNQNKLNPGKIKLENCHGGDEGKNQVVVCLFYIFFQNNYWFNISSKIPTESKMF